MSKRDMKNNLPEKPMMDSSGKSVQSACLAIFKRLIAVVSIEICTFL